MFKRDILTGIDEIRKYLEVSSDMIVLDWHRGYDLPVRKEGGIWKARKSDLKKWKKEHNYLTEIPPPPRRLTRLTQR